MSPEAQRIAMTPLQINRAIARVVPDLAMIDGAGVPVWMRNTREEFEPTIDLNAMHEAERVFIGPKEWGEYCDKLRWVITQHIENEGGPGSICGIVCLEMAVNATASQRAEAFLRTIGKWQLTP